MKKLLTLVAIDPLRDGKNQIACAVGEVVEVSDECAERVLDEESPKFELADEDAELGLPKADEDSEADEPQEEKSDDEDADEPKPKKKAKK